MTEQQCRDLLKLMGAAYWTQRQRMGNDDVRAMVAVYTAGLLDLDFARVREAINRLVKSSTFMPSIAEIRAAAVDVAHGRRTTGGEAWGQCLEMIRLYGAHRCPGVDFVVDDPILRATIRALGWPNLCRSEQQHADRARFIDHYDRLATNERKEAAIAPNATLHALPGHLPSNNPRAMDELVRGLIPGGESA